MSATPSPLRLAILISGGGTTMTNLADRIQRGALAAEIGLVIASNERCGGIAKAVERGLATEVFDRKQYDSVESFSDDVFHAIREAGCGLVCLGGFLSLLRIPADYAGRVMNIHPALLPSFGGKGYYGHHVHEAVLAQGCKVSGCTVHFADNEYDHGPIIEQRCVPVMDTDTPDTLAARVFEQECEAYPHAIGLFAAGRIRIDGHVVRIG
jgi:phosphoribosylglycinamide formyltransferase-1